MALERETFEATERFSPSQLSRSVRSRHQEVWVLDAGTSEGSALFPGATSADRLAGALILRPYRHIVRIESVAVARAYQGRGIGTRLLHHAIERARAQGARRVVLEVRTGARRALRWYRHHGFDIVRRLPHHYGPDRHGVRMERAVEAAPRARPTR